MHTVHCRVKSFIIEESNMDTVVKAVRTLREQLGESQQAFAARLGLSIRAIANYEKDRRPTGVALAALARAAEDAGQLRLTYTFVNALIEELELKDRDIRLMSAGRKGDQLHGLLLTHLSGVEEVEYGFAFFDMIEELNSDVPEQRARAKARLTALKSAVAGDPERKLPAWAETTEQEKRDRGSL